MAEKILVVDDDIESVKLVGLMLQRRGYEIIAAQSGAQALVKTQEEEPDLVILDVMMPDMDGYEVCRRLRANPETAELPVIMFTAKTQVDEKVIGFEAGADDYLTKPIHPNELASRVEAVLQRASRRQTEESAVPKAKMIGFIGTKGGVGTTTLAINAACGLVRGPAEGERVVLAELRAGGATSAIQLDLRGHGGILDLLDKPVKQIDGRLVEAQLEEHKSGVLVLSGQTEPEGIAKPLFTPQAEAIVNRLGAFADYLLLDLGTGLGELNRRLLPGCYYVVVAIEPQRMAITLGQALLDEMTHQLNIAHHRIGVVLMNKAASATTYNKDTIEGLLQHDLVGVIPPAPDLAFQANEQGVPMVMMHPASLVARQVRGFVDKLVEL